MTRIIYETKRQEILEKILEILELKDNAFYLNELDNNIEKQSKLLELDEIIRENFKAGELAYFKKNANFVKPYLSMIRSIFKVMEYNIVTQKIYIKIDGQKKYTQKYIIFKSGETVNFNVKKVINY